MKAGNIRNFCIISHIDHGKSTLADCFLKLSGAVSSKEIRPQFLDMMDLEREKGITIKLQPVRLKYIFDSQVYYLNLIDTPGHVDFSYEVSRSLAAVEGAVLLVDATKGIQAQTIANLEMARKQGLVIIPVINKIDLAQARVEETAEEMSSLLKISKNEIIKISAKNMTNVEKVLEAIVKKIPCPEQKEEDVFRALIFDSQYDSFKGVIAYVRIFGGEAKKGQKIYLLGTGAQGEIKDLGYFIPYFSSQEKISSGEIGYIATGIKESGKVRVGDTIALDPKVSSLPGYQEPKPVVFASLYPADSDDFDLLKEGLEKLKLNDPSLIFEPESKEGLGRGFRCGFLGSLHIEIITERLKREFGLDLIISTPSVVYKMITKKGKEKMIYSPLDWEENFLSVEEPWVLLEIVSPIRYLGPLSEVLKKIRGVYIDTKYISAERVVLSYEAPVREIIVNFYDKIKSVSQGYASMSYHSIGYRPADLVKMDIFIAGRKEEAFSKIVPRNQAYQEGSLMVKKLKEFLPAQQFSVALQAAVGGKIIARETIKARRKDVTAPLYGGDVTRKKKLLEKQKKGKKMLKEKGRVNIPTKVFLELFRS